MFKLFFKIVTIVATCTAISSVSLGYQTNKGSDFVDYCKQKVQGRKSEGDLRYFTSACEEINNVQAGDLVVKVLNQYNRYIDLNIFRVIANVQTEEQATCFEEEIMKYIEIEFSMNNLVQLCPSFREIPLVRNFLMER